MLPVIQVGPLALQTPGLVILLAIWLGLSQAEKSAGRFGLDGSSIYNLAMAGLAAGVIGARLAYILRFPQAFEGNIFSVLALSPALMDWSGGLLAGLLAALIYGQRNGIPFWPTLDAVTPAIAVFMIGLALSHLASGSAFGAPAELPWSIELWGQNRHPSQVYELILAAGIALLTRPPAHTADRPAGWLFLTFAACTAGARIFLEFFRGDSTLLYGFHTAQLAGWVILAVSLMVMRRLWRLQARPS